MDVTAEDGQRFLRRPYKFCGRLRCKLAVFVAAMCDDKGKLVSDETAFVWRMAAGITSPIG